MVVERWWRGGGGGGVLYVPVDAADFSYGEDRRHSSNHVLNK